MAIFGIDLHIDDDLSVKQNGIQYGYNVLIIDKDDNDWAKKVIIEAERIKREKVMSGSLATQKL